MDLHIFFLPFLAPGHMIPMVDLARLFAARGIKATVVTTPANAALIGPSIHRANAAHHEPIHLLTLPFASSSGLPDNLTGLPTPDVTPAFTAATDALQAPFRRLLEDHRPDCIVSDVFYPWTSELAQELGIPRLAFHGTSFFAVIVLSVLGRLKAHCSAADDDEPFDVPGLPHRIRMSRSQLPEFLTAPSDAGSLARMGAAYRQSYGAVMNSFYALEPDYVDRMRGDGVVKVWHVGPVSLCNRDEHDKAVRGDGAGADRREQCLRWLDRQRPGSVVYVCFGSLGRFPAAQLREIAAGLAASGRPFIWVATGSTKDEKTTELPLEEAGEMGLIIRGWAPQTLILAHRAVGGFVTHCGWNSSLEGISAGVPMMTWPLFAEQAFNERLIVDVLGVGVAVGVNKCSYREEERGLVTEMEIRRAVETLMGGGEEADGRRRLAAELAGMAKKAVDSGGSSFNDLTLLVEDLLRVKASSK